MTAIPIIMEETVTDSVAVEPVEAFSSADVCALTGATYRQLDYWVRNNVIISSLAQATGSGTQRRYSASDVAQVRAVVRCAQAAVGVPTLREITGALRADPEARWVLIHPTDTLRKTTLEGQVFTSRDHHPRVVGFTLVVPID